VDKTPHFAKDIVLFVDQASVISDADDDGGSVDFEEPPVGRAMSPLLAVEPSDMPASQGLDMSETRTTFVWA